MRILLADEQGLLRRGVKDILQEALDDAEFSETGDAADALEQVRRQDWDVVLLDIDLFGGNGLDLLKDMKHRRPRMPVLMLASKPEDYCALRALKADASGCLAKEAPPHELISAVKKTLGGGKYVSASQAEALASHLCAKCSGPPHEALSDREFQVMCRIASGRAVSQIADEICLSVKTISTYRARVMAKMRMKTNADLMRYALDHKLIA